jgi:hypothetical protein
MNQNVDKLIIPIDKLKYKKTRILQYDELKFLSDITNMLVVDREYSNASYILNSRMWLTAVRL